MNFGEDLKSIERDIKRFAIRYGAFETKNEKLQDHLADTINILEHIARKHKPKQTKLKERVAFT